MTCKPFDIPKTLIWEAWLHVKANQGAAGIDAVRWTRTIGQEIKLGLLLRRTDLNDGQTEAVFGGIQGEGCS
jgi:hypothetical protein